MAKMKLEGVEVLKKMQELGFEEIQIGGCGCCGSPWVKLVHKDWMVDDEKVNYTLKDGKMEARE